MVTSQLDFPVWKTKENIKVRQNTEISYKYVVFLKGKFDHWEDLPSNVNRVINVKNLVRIVIHDTQDVPTSRIENFTKLNFSVDDEYAHSHSFEMDIFENKFDQKSQRCKKIFYYDNKHDLFLTEPNSRNRTKENLVEEEYKELNYQSDSDHDYIADKSKVVVKEISENDKIIMASLYLPYQVEKNDRNEWIITETNQPFYNTLSKLTTKKNYVWIGLIKHYYDIPECDREVIVTTLQKRYNMHVVKLSQTQLNNLNKLITNVLEPMFHYITIFNDLGLIKQFEDLWKAFKEFNELVSKTIITYLRDNTLVFLHDYHMLLAPSFIYNAHHYNFKTLKNISIGLFMHSPFPSHDVFRRFPYREEILQSMMNCSILGFHTFDSSRNFLTSCKRLLSHVNYESNLNGDLALSYYGRNVIIRVKHVSSEPELIKQAIDKDDFKRTYSEIKEKHKDKYIFVSVDNLLFLAGVRHKLEGYKRFLRDIEDNYKQNVLIQYLYQDDSLISEEEIESIKELRKEIHKLAEAIKKEFGDDILEIKEGYITYPERLAILAAGNCFVRTCKRESFSLDIYEFLNLKILLNDYSEVGYILSELSGVISSLSGAIKVNPFDFKSIQKGFLEAFQVHFDKEKLSTAQEKDLLHVKKNSTSKWLDSFLKDIKNSNESDENFHYLGVGTRLNFRLMKISSNFKELNRKSILEDYDKARKRLILLDYEGTLPSSTLQGSEYYSKGSYPSPKILKILEHLTKDKRNTIFIVTGREAKLVSDWFSCLASEHGHLYRYSSPQNGKWEKMLKNFNIDWRSYTVEQLEPYTDRCEGSFIEVKEASVVWQYRDCEVELGKSFANVITSDLENSLKHLNLNIINGKGYVEIKTKGINKGAFASFLLKLEIKRGRAPDFIVAIGDDTSDEEMFRYFHKKKNEIRKNIKNAKIYTITVGKKPSKADSFLESPTDVKNLLEAFMHVSMRKRLSISTFDIRNLALTNDSTFELSNSSGKFRRDPEELVNSDRDDMY